MASNGKFQGREVVIVEAVRTPIGRGHEEKGYYKDVHASNLLAKTFKELIDRTGIEAAEVEDVVTGCVQQFGEQGLNIGRNAWLEAGLPIETPATTIDRQCGSAQQAVNFAAALVASGVHDAAIGGGVEHMGHISFADSMSVQKEHGFAFSPQLLERYNLVPQGISAEMIADKWEIPRSELDEIGLRSHQLAAKATEEGRFERETIPFAVNGDTYVTDQGIRPDTSLEKLSELKPAFKEDGKITAGNSSQISDGAAAVLRDDPREGRRARADAARPDRGRDHGGRRPRDDAHRTDPRDAEAPGAKRNEHRRHRPDRDQRGFRLRGCRLAARARARHGQGQCQRRGDRPRPPAWLDGRAADHDAPPRAGALRHGVGPRDDVLRRRPRNRDADPTRLTEADEHLRSVDHVLRGLIDEGGPIDPETDRRGSRPDAYQALARAIVGQQLSTKAAASIWGRVTELFDDETPSPAQLIEADGQTLRDAGLSWSKVGFLKDLGRAGRGWAARPGPPQRALRRGRRGDADRDQGDRALDR